MTLELNPALDAPLVCPTLVGREAELAALGGLLSAARGAQLRVAIVEGDAGIGKTRLVREAAELALRQGWSMIYGAALESDLTTPFALAGELGRSAGLPGHRELHAARIAWRRLLQRLAGRGPVLLVAEDAHWADEASLQLLEVVCRDVAGLPVAIVLTARSGEATPQFLHLRASLERARVASELRLGPLSRSAVADFIAATLEMLPGPRDELNDAIANLTDGNPFFIEETLRALVAQGDIVRVRTGWERLPMTRLRVPHSVQEAVLRRTEGLGGDTRRMLHLAAVCGRRLDLDLLAAAADASPAAVTTALAELLATQLFGLPRVRWRLHFWGMKESYVHIEHHRQGADPPQPAPIPGRAA